MQYVRNRSSQNHAGSHHRWHISRSRSDDSRECQQFGGHVCLKAYLGVGVFYRPRKPVMFCFKFTLPKPCPRFENEIDTFGFKKNNAVRNCFNKGKGKSKSQSRNVEDHCILCYCCIRCCLRSWCFFSATPSLWCKQRYYGHGQVWQGAHHYCL